MGSILQQLNEIRSRFLDLRYPFLKPSFQYPSGTDLHRRVFMLRKRQKLSHRVIVP